MAIAPIPFPNEQAYSAFDFSPLARLGQIGQQAQRNQMLANLGPTPANTASPLSDVTPTPGGTNAPFAAPPTSSDVNAAIKATAARAGMDVPTWKAIASIESSLNPGSNYNRPTQYKGLFQIGSNEFETHGKGNVYDAMDNASAAASLAQRNNATFRNTFDRDPTPAETYMMHQQGPGFYTSGTMTNIVGNPYPGMSGPQTPESFAEGWRREIERRAKYFRQFEDSKNGN
jgi:hypothetical protein